MKRFPMPLPFGWYGIAYADDIAPGQSKALKYFDRELVLFRTEAGEAALLNAHCPHMGAHLGHGVADETGKGGRVEGDCIRCPFHAWAWSKEGECKDIPYASKIPDRVKQLRIPSYPLVERNKILYAWYHPQAEPPSFEVLEYPEVHDLDWCDDFDRYEWTMKTHPQEQAENGVDRAHFRFVHGTREVPESEVSYAGTVQQSIQQAPMMTPKGEVEGKIISSINGPGDTMTRFSGICDTLLLGLPVPVDTETVHLRFAFLQKKVEGNAPEGGVASAIVADLCKQVTEDQPIWETKGYRPSPILCDSDGPIARFRKYYSQFYHDYDEKQALAEMGWRE